MIYDSLSGVMVSEGDVVFFDQKIGDVGDTLILEVADEDHVHIELRILGKEEDPMKYFE